MPLPVQCTDIHGASHRTHSVLARLVICGCGALVLAQCKCMPLCALLALLAEAGRLQLELLQCQTLCQRWRAQNGPKNKFKLELFICVLLFNFEIITRPEWEAKQIRLELGVDGSTAIAHE